MRLECRGRLGIGLEIDGIVVDQAEHQAPAIQPGAAEHAADADAAQGSEQLLGKIDEFGTRAHAAQTREIGRASCRERVWQSVSISVVAVSLKKKSRH